ncbi:unnamed protein product [Vicia faba]|nr:unnamed protein product [Vicia faba]
MDVKPKVNSTWIMRGILEQVGFIGPNVAVWNTMRAKGKIRMKSIYNILKPGADKSWHRLMKNNLARPRAIIILWLACHMKLATKSRLVIFDLMTNSECGLCNKEETIQYMFFECEEIKNIWSRILQRIQVNHTPKIWDEEIAPAETIYGAWNFRNGVCFGKIMDREIAVQDIISRLFLEGGLVRFLSHILLD